MRTLLTVVLASLFVKAICYAGEPILFLAHWNKTASANFSSGNLKPSSASKYKITNINTKFGTGALDLIDDGSNIIYDQIKNIGAEGTVEFWIKPAWDFSANKIKRQYLRINSNVKNRIQLRTSDSPSENQSMIFIIENEEGVHFVQAYKLNWAADTWHHIAVTWGKDGMRLYLDGDLRAKNSYAGGLSPVEDYVALGKYASWSADINASVDELKIMSRQLSAEEIQADCSRNAEFSEKEESI
ncbi:LamG domain-containing protein [bacterium]|nr:LamG domain-containing protein [bacterium]